jgi:hypothetical protein
MSVRVRFGLTELSKSRFGFGSVRLIFQNVGSSSDRFGSFSLSVPLTLDAIKRYNLENRVIFGAVDRIINKELQKQKFTSIPICVDIETMMEFSHVYKTRSTR